MGMTNDNVDLPEIEKPTISNKKKEEPDIKEPTVVVAGCIWLKDGLYQLGIDKNRKMYKAPKIGEYRADEKNRSPLLSIFGDFVPITEEDYK